MPLFVKIERGKVPKSEFDRHVPAHLDFVKGLIAEGRKARSGYWSEKGGGMLLFEAADADEARAIVSRDPLVANGCVDYELHEWTLVAG